ncbi:dimethylsulfonioproprionate lyase family protein [Rhizobium calliandrae]|uniref:Dimethylsulfonioproprionate lyase family protein n=1 Tax=Rhizobium calliandrae TaxID=1312182 RepID=A0ABT7KPH6_9HYPH|nr:dimethylsulfonioproprionate lyase family protein [Rhizobium calliandrae]MDL2409910.1 dimethylsulfonioproprionate lyase family protein [Rhizobium calliandrae]
MRKIEFGLRAPNARPAPVQSFANALCELLLAATAPDMASFVAGQIYSRLHRIGMLRAGGADDVLQPEAWWSALELAGKRDRQLTRMVEALSLMSPMLIWTKGRSGPFASANYAIGHGSAMIVGPGGLEDRDDVQISLTLTEPYCRSPDRAASERQIFLFLSSAQISIGDGAWNAVTPGSIAVIEAGSKSAMRCTRDPLLAVRCKIEDVRR